MKAGELGSSSESRRDDRYQRVTGRAKTDAVLRLLKGESIEAVSQELGVTIPRIERWKNRFLEAGSIELARRKEERSKGWAAKHSGSIRQWIWLFVALVAVITILAVFMQHSPQE
jgi:transposase